MKTLNFYAVLLPLILFSNLAKSNYNDSLIHFNKAYYLYNKEKYNEAIREFTNSIDFENRFNYESYFFRGLAYLELKDFDLAILDFTTSIKLNGNSTYKKYYSYLNRGVANNGAGNLDSAINDFNEALEILPNSNFALKRRAEVFYKEFNYESALADVNKALEHTKIKEEKSDLYCLRGDIYKEIGLTKNENIDLYLLSLGDYNKSIELNKKNIDAYIGRGLVKCLLKDYRGGIIEFNNVIIMSSGFYSAYYYRGCCKFHLKRFNDAISDFNISITKKPNDELAYYFRAKCKLELKNISGACLDWSKAGELGLKMAYDEINKFCK